MESEKTKHTHKIRIKKSQASHGASPELLDMLRKLGGWNPKSDEAVLEAANRLAQAAREKVSPDLFGDKGTSVAEAVKTCMALVGHTLSKFNGINDDHAYVMDVTTPDDKTILLHTAYMFRRNRVGELAVSMRTIYVSPGDVTADYSRVSGKRRGSACPVPGYELDTQEAAATFRKLGGLIKCVSKALPKPAARKRTKP